MPQPYGYLLAALWLGWLSYWILSASAVKTTAREESWQSQIAYSAPLWLAAILLIGGGRWFLSARFLPRESWIVVIGVLIAAGGFAFTIWARRHLGANWSGRVTVKEGHELVRTGPYAVVRHPIYTGLTLAFLGTAVAVGEWRAVLALVIAVASFCYKLTIEERVMTETFGREYNEYRRRTKALIPFVI
jgi:protein-S-isoprenylcysteine O-methyltransferase Ste14